MLPLEKMDKQGLYLSQHLHYIVYALAGILLLSAVIAQPSVSPASPSCKASGKSRLTKPA